MPLLDRSKSPPGGFPYREPSINWTSPADGAVFDIRVRQIQQARANNPSMGLDPDYNACSDALDTYTCTRLKNDHKWCVVAVDPVAAALVASRKSKPCSSCGVSRKKRDASTSKRAEELLVK